MKAGKRFSALVLAFALLLALAGCGARAQSEAPAPNIEHRAPSPSAPSEAEQPETDKEAEGSAPQGGSSDSLRGDDISGTESGGDAPSTPSESVAPACTVSISCAAMLSRMDELSPETAELIPPDGVLLPPTQVALEGGESAFDVLRLVCRENGIHMEFSETPVYQSVYIEGIGNLYEFACGSGSGWMYRVNGVFPNYGCSRCTLADGDVLEWVYTCDYGADVGGTTEAAA